MKENVSTIQWFQVTTASPCPGKEVLVSIGGVISISLVESIMVHPDGKGWDIQWRGGLKVIKWAFLPQAATTEPEQVHPTEISIW